MSDNTSISHEAWAICHIHEAWAIRHIPSGSFLPMYWERTFHLYSHDEPTYGAFPRLFPSRMSAQNALNAWLAGHWKTEIESEYEEGWPSHSYRTAPIVQKSGADLGRRKEDMEVVRVTLTVEEGNR